MPGSLSGSIAEASPVARPALTSGASEPAPAPRADRPRAVPGVRLAGRRALGIERALAGFVVGAPLVGTAGALAYGLSHGASLLDAGVLVGTYALTGFGITVGYHRLFTHRSFECPRWVRAAFAIAGSMALQGPVIRWVADHRRHHAFSDQAGDPHSPHVSESGRGAVRRFFDSHAGWFFSAEKTRPRRYAPDLLDDPLIRGIDRLYLVWMVLTFALPFALGLTLGGSLDAGVSALLWGGFVRLFLVHHVTWCINSVCHVFGSRPHATRDRSTNNAWLAIPSLGESWHNNHHAFPTSARHGLAWWQVDLSALLIGALSAVGLASNVRGPRRDEGAAAEA